MSIAPLFALFTALAAPFEGISTVSIPADAGIEARTFRAVARTLPEDQRSSHEDLKAWSHRLHLLEAVPNGMFVWTTEAIGDIPAGTPVMLFEIVSGRMVVAVTPGGRVQGSRSGLEAVSLTPPEGASFPAYVPEDPAKTSGSRARGYAALVPELADELAAFDAEVDRMKQCASRVTKARAGEGVDPSQWNLVSYDRNGEVTSIKRWSEVIGDEVARTCDPERTQKADEAFTRAVIAVRNQHGERVFAELRARLLPEG